MQVNYEDIPNNVKYDLNRYLLSDQELFFQKRVFRYSINPRLFHDSHLIIKFERIDDSAEAKSTIISVRQDFGIT
jgi:hypothetical protein